MAQKLQTDKLKSLDTIVSRAPEIAVLPQVIHKILETTEAEDGSPQDIERAVSIDPGFSAKMIALANSAQYSLPRKISSIREACMMLGFRQIRELALSAGVFDFFVGKTDRESLRRRDWWRFSVDTANMAKWVATKTGQNAPEAYTVGLLHLVGKTLIDQSDPTAYDKVLYVTQRGAPERLAEVTVFAVDHIMVAQEMARQWHFPERFVDGLNYADEPADLAAESSLAAVLHVARGLVAIGRDGKGDSPTGEIKGWAAKRIGVDPLTLSEWIQTAQSQFEAASSTSVVA